MGGLVKTICWALKSVSNRKIEMRDIDCGGNGYSTMFEHKH